LLLFATSKREIRRWVAELELVVIGFEAGSWDKIFHGGGGGDEGRRRIRRREMGINLLNNYRNALRAGKKKKNGAKIRLRKERVVHGRYIFSNTTKENSKMDQEKKKKKNRGDSFLSFGLKGPVTSSSKLIE